MVVAAALPFSDDENSSDHYGSFVSHFVLQQAGGGPKKRAGTKIGMQRYLNKSVARKGNIFANKFGPEDMLKWIETWTHHEGAACSGEKPVAEVATS